MVTKAAEHRVIKFFFLAIGFQVAMATPKNKNHRS